MLLNSLTKSVRRGAGVHAQAVAGGAEDLRLQAEEPVAVHEQRAVCREEGGGAGRPPPARVRRRVAGAS